MEGSAGSVDPATVERATRLGRVRGLSRLGVETYRGLRYAEPPKRFQASVLTTTPWTGVRDGTRFGAMAPQPDILPEVYGPVPDAPYAEDCLFLNIHTPDAASEPQRSRLPVILFIHGGSFTGGSGNCYDGTALAKGADAVVVSINYRLGVFAALDLEWLGTERDGGGQLWLGDQVNALKWVRDNIADYGGDPDCVTIAGESAGAVSVAALCAAPAAKGLVHRAVACSTGYLVAEPSTDVVAVIAKARKCSRAQAVAYLESAPVHELIGLQKRGKAPSPIPVANTPLLPGRMEDLIAARGPQAVPMIAGYATHEGLSVDLMFRLATGWPAWLRAVAGYVILRRAIAMHGARGRAKVPAYLKRLAKAGGASALSAKFNDLIWTDGFRRGAVEYAEMARAAGSRGYVYVIDLPMRFGGETIPASHGIDVALTFDPYDDPQHNVPKFVDHPDAAALARRWVAMLGHFARHGEPGPALGQWPEYETSRRASMWVDGSGYSVKHDVEKTFREQVWVAGEPA